MNKGRITLNKKMISLALASAVCASLFAPTFRVDAKSLHEDGLKQIVEDVHYAKPATTPKEWTKKGGEYKYPIDISDSKWKIYKTHEQMLQACNLPKEILETASTEELLELVFNYPLLCDLYAYDSNEQGIEAVARQFNVFEELLNRKDAADIFFQTYMNENINEVVKSSEEEFRKVSEVVVLEGLLAQPDTANELSTRQKTRLFQRIEENRESKEFNSLFEENMSTFYEISQKNGTLEIYQTGLKAADKKYYVKTPNGTKVAVLKNKYNGKSWAEDLNNQYRQAYPWAVQRGPSDNRYNCHSYAWYKQSKSNRYWMNSPKKYVTDGSYRYVGKSATAKSQKVVYKYQSGPIDTWLHSGVTLDKNGKIKSKWGQAPLMEHMRDYCPYWSQQNVMAYYKR